MNNIKKYMNNNMGPTKFSAKFKNLFFKTQSKRRFKVRLHESYFQG